MLLVTPPGSYFNGGGGGMPYLVREGDPHLDEALSNESDSEGDAMPVIVDTSSDEEAIPCARRWEI